jgi:DeoR family transcriptional regulator, suf operon transcriptional repressor
MMADTSRGPEGFSSAKRQLLLTLKQHPGLSLREIAQERNLSKVAALKHLTVLEREGLVERSYERQKLGRPSVHFRLSARSRRLFPEAYTQMSICALEFIERQMGHDAVVRMLQERTREVEAQGRPRLTSSDLPTRVHELVQIRSEGGYMAEWGGQRGKTMEMREHNCPILAVAARYPEACEVERRLFEKMLGASVETSHRVVAGDPVCRFLIRPRPGAP